MCPGPRTGLNCKQELDVSIQSLSTLSGRLRPQINPICEGDSAHGAQDDTTAKNDRQTIALLLHAYRARVRRCTGGLWYAICNFQLTPLLDRLSSVRIQLRSSRCSRTSSTVSHSEQPGKIPTEPPFIATRPVLGSHYP